MSRPRGEITSRKNERDNPHIVEMSVPPSGFGAALKAMHDWHKQYAVASKQGVSWRDGAGTDYIRWCFAVPVIADAFVERFGGHRLTAKPSRYFKTCVQNGSDASR